MPGFRELDREESDLARFVDICGRLRFQERWTQTPIVPKCAVLDHELTVACLTYLLSSERGLDEKAKINNFFGGLFRDFLEVMTRDIVAPFRRKAPALDKVIQQYALEEFDCQMAKMLPDAWRQRLRFYAIDEFNDKQDYNGQMVKASDNLSAFCEA